MKLSTIILIFKEKFNQIQRLYITIAIIMLLLFFIGGFIVNLPVLLLISVYALLVSNAALVFNKKVLNSLASPLTFNYLFVMVYDFSQINFLFGFFHLITVIPCLIIIFRTNLSLAIMLLASVIYTFWILSIEIFLDFPYYKCIFEVCDLRIHFIIVLIIGVLTSIITSNHKLKLNLLNCIKTKLNLKNE